MADKKISQLDSANALTGDELVPIVQSGSTKITTVGDLKKQLPAIPITAEDGVDIDLGVDTYKDARMIKYSWTGDNGTAVHTLPDATTNTNRLIRFIADSSFSSSKHVDLTPKSGQTLDGSSNKYRINKDYEGIAVWSDGTEWFVIQKKA